MSIAHPIRIGNCSGFYGDRASAMADMARAGGIDVLTGDYLAEVTMLILGKARAKDSTKGYATTFLQHLDAALEHLVANGIRLVVNAGGLNPAGLAAATRELIARRGHDLRVSHIEGDDVFGRLDALQQAGHSLPHLTSGEPLSSWPHQPLTANAYLGGFGIARALRQRRRHRHHRPRRRRLTGRRCRRLVVELDPARLRRPRRRASAAGHVIECGPQATGGNFSGFRTIADLVAARVPDRRDRRRRLLGDHQEPGHRRRRHHGHGHRPAALRDRRTRLPQPRRDHPPGHRRADRPRRRPRRDPRRARLGATRDDQGRDHRGRRLGEQRDLRAHRHRPRREGRPRRAIRPPLRRGRRRARRGRDRPYRAGAARSRQPERGNRAAQDRRAGHRRRPPGAPSRRGWSSWRCPATPGCTPSARRNRGRHSASTGPHCSTRRCSSTRSTTTTAPPRPSHPATHTAPSGEVGAAGRAVVGAVGASAVDADELVVASLGEIVHARSGDKGGDANLGVWVRDRQAWDWLRSTLTVDELRRLLPETRDLAISRYELPNLGAVNFVLRGLLGTGATSTLRLDAQAKALGEWLRSRSTKVPRSLVAGGNYR